MELSKGCLTIAITGVEDPADTEDANYGCMAQIRLFFAPGSSLNQLTFFGESITMVAAINFQFSLPAIPLANEIDLINRIPENTELLGSILAFFSALKLRYYHGCVFHTIRFRTENEAVPEKLRPINSEEDIDHLHQEGSTLQKGGKKQKAKKLYNQLLRLLRHISSKTGIDYSWELINEKSPMYREILDDNSYLVADDEAGVSASGSNRESGAQKGGEIRNEKSISPDDEPPEYALLHPPDEECTTITIMDGGLNIFNWLHIYSFFEAPWQRKILKGLNYYVAALATANTTENVVDELEILLELIRFYDFIGGNIPKIFSERLRALEKLGVKPSKKDPETDFEVPNTFFGREFPQTILPGPTGGYFEGMKALNSGPFAQTEQESDAVATEYSSDDINKTGPEGNHAEALDLLEGPEMESSSSDEECNTPPLQEDREDSSFVDTVKQKHLRAVADEPKSSNDLDSNEQKQENSSSDKALASDINKKGYTRILSRREQYLKEEFLSYYQLGNHEIVRRVVNKLETKVWDEVGISKEEGNKMLEEWKRELKSRDGVKDHVNAPKPLTRSSSKNQEEVTTDSKGEGEQVEGGQVDSEEQPGDNGEKEQSQDGQVHEGQNEKGQNASEQEQGGEDQGDEGQGGKDQSDGDQDQSDKDQKEDRDEEKQKQDKDDEDKDDEDKDEDDEDGKKRDEEKKLDAGHLKEDQVEQEVQANKTTPEEEDSEEKPDGKAPATGTKDLKTIPEELLAEEDTERKCTEQIRECSGKVQSFKEAEARITDKEQGAVETMTTATGSDQMTDDKDPSVKKASEPEENDCERKPVDTNGTADDLRQEKQVEKDLFEHKDVKMEPATIEKNPTDGEDSVEELGLRAEGNNS